MFLIRAILPPVCAVVCLAACLGCAVRHDAGEVAGRRVSGARVDSSMGEYSFLGMHADRGPDWRRARRAEHLVGDPKLVPTAREQRIARAMAEEESRLVRQGGMMLYRWDGSASKPTKVDFVASPGALTIEYAASKKLNCVDGGSHALLLVVYHLSDKAAFDQLAVHEDGIRKLLEGERFDGSVKSVRKFNVQPGASGRLLFDRPEGGKYVAIAAGYANPEKESSIYVTEYGVGRWATPGADVWSRNTYMFSPQPLEISMRLGETEMAAKNCGKMLGKLEKTRDLTLEQVRYLTFREIEGYGEPDSVD